MSRESLAALSFLIFGALVCWGSWTLGIGTLLAPRAGFMPFLAGASIVCISAILLVLSWLIQTKSSTRGATHDSANHAEIGHRIGITAAALTLLAAALEYLGFAVAVFLLIFVLFRYVERQSLRGALLFAGSVTTALVLVFQIALRVQLPVGILWR